MVDKLILDVDTADATCDNAKRIRKLLVVSFEQGTKGGDGDTAASPFEERVAKLADKLEQRGNHAEPVARKSAFVPLPPNNTLSVRRRESKAATETVSTTVQRARARRRQHRRRPA
jgi:hypothetical protein